MFTVDEVLGRILTFTAGIERNLVKLHNVRKILSFNHKNLHLVAPQLMKDYYMTYEVLPVQAASGDDPKHLLLTNATMLSAKEIVSVIYQGNPSEAYKFSGSAESFATLSAGDEELRFGRWWFHTRGKDRILIWQGEDIPISESQLAVYFVRSVDSSNYDTKRGHVFNRQGNFDCPEELVEFLIMQTARDVMLEAGNKLQDLSNLSQLIGDRQALITGLDAAKSAGQSAQDNLNKDYRT